ncbi:hypothetical protein AAC387_Pa03g3908 [Persea americana]
MLCPVFIRSSFTVKPSIYRLWTVAEVTIEEQLIVNGKDLTCFRWAIWRKSRAVTVINHQEEAPPALLWPQMGRTVTSYSLSSSPKKSLEKRCRPIDAVIVETQIKGSLFDCLLQLEVRVFKLE